MADQSHLDRKYFIDRAILNTDPNVISEVNSVGQASIQGGFG